MDALDVGGEEGDLPDADLFERDGVRLSFDGKWVCENCFDDAPAWTYATKPSDPIDEPDEPRWRDLPEVPNYVPEQR